MNHLSYEEIQAYDAGWDDALLHLKITLRNHPDLEYLAGRGYVISELALDSLVYTLMKNVR